MDLAVAYLSAVIAIGPSDYTASIMDGPLLARSAALVWFASVAARRFAPAVALWCAAAATVAAVFAGIPVTNASLATALALALVLRNRPLRPAMELAILPVGAVVAVLASPSDAFVLVLVVHAVAIVVGRAGRIRWEAGEAERLRESERKREAAAARTRRALVAERARMARELHDAVGHAVTVMVTHAGAARLALGPEQGEVRVALGHIEQVGRAAMADLDGILGLLTSDDSESDACDWASVAESLRALVASLPPGVSADLRLVEDPAALRRLDRGTSDVVYRVVQESLTNVIRHAGPAHATVDLDVGEDSVRVEVRDDGGAAPGTFPTAGGRGLKGMRDRVAVLGGVCEAGPMASGGWRVGARIPLGARWSEEVR